MHDAVTLFPHKSEPETQWVYQSSATFLVTQAMNAYLKKKQGADADLFRMWINDVAKPLNTSRGFWSTIRTDDSETGGPAGYYGLFWATDDVAKFTTMLNRGDGIIGRDHALDARALQASLFRSGSNGLEIPGAPLYGREDAPVPSTWYYTNAFWGKHVTRAEYPEVKCDFWVSMMFGYGGVVIAMFPNGTSFYLFSDSDEAHWYEAMTELDKVSPMCKAER